MARQGLDRERVVAAAAAIADADGLEAVTLARLAADLGVRPPSLYNHVEGLDGVRRGIALRALAELGAAMREAATGRAGADALLATARAYRDYVLEHPGSYAASVAAAPPEDAELARAGGEAVDIVLAVLRGWNLEGDDAIHAARAFRATVHGFSTIEAAGGFGIDLDRDASFERLLAALAAGLDGHRHHDTGG